MAASKRIHCAICDKKCSGKVLRYQDQYYHKQCFELEQSEGKRIQQLASSPADSIQQQQPDEARLLPLHRPNGTTMQTYQHQQRSQTIDGRPSRADLQGNTTTTTTTTTTASSGGRSATLPHSNSSPANGFSGGGGGGGGASSMTRFNSCAGCKSQIRDGQALIALDLHWHVWCFKCAHCKIALHGEYVAKDGRAYCEKDYQRLFGVTCVYCKRFITGKVLQAGEAHHFHPSCARCSKCGDPFVPGEEMYLQGEVTWHPRCGPGPESAAGNQQDESTIEASNRSQLRLSRAQSPSLSSRSHSRSVSPFSFMSRQYGRTSPSGYAESEALGDLSRVYTISYLNADPTQGYLRRPIEPMAPKSPQFSRPTSATRDCRSSRSSSRSQHYQNYTTNRERSVPRGMYSVLSSMRSDSSSRQRARSPSMMNEEAIQMAQYPSGQKPSPDSVPKIERDDFPAPPYPYPSDRTRSASANVSELGKRDHQQQQLQSQPAGQRQERASRPRSREIVINDDDDDDSTEDDPQLRKEEQELSKIANGIGKIFLQTLKEREKLRAWKRANLDPRNASRTPSATRELPSRLRYDNPTNASPSRDMDRPRPWEEDDSDQSPNRTRSSLGRPSHLSSSSNYGFKVVQSSRSTPRPGYGVSAGPYGSSSAVAYNNNNNNNSNGLLDQNGGGGGGGEFKTSEMAFSQQQRLAENRSNELLSRSTAANLLQSDISGSNNISSNGRSRPPFGVSQHLRRSMPNVVDHLHQDGPPKLYPYHLLATSNYRLPPDVDRCHLERHLSNEEFQYIFHCDRLDFYRLPAWKRNELKRRVKLF